MARHISNFKIRNPKVNMAAWAIFIVVGAIMALVALMMLLGSAVRKAQCSERVSAVVVDNVQRETKTPKRHSKTARRHAQTTPTITYAPIYEYEYNGQTYRVESSTSSNPPRHHKGEHIELMIDPDNPTRLYDKSGAATVVYLIILGASGIFLLIGIVGESFAVKRFKAIKSYEQQQTNTYN